MDYEKQYKEALERAKKIFSSKRSVLVKKQTLESIFPELAENEDENLKNKSGYYKAGKFWKASTLWDAVKNKKAQRVENRFILQECSWNIGTLQRFADEVRNVQEVSLDYPIILDMNGNILDGAHRVVKAYLEGKDIDVVYLGDDEWPEPDYDEEKAVKESEDERTRKLNLWFLRKYKEISHYPGNSQEGIDMVISYLEKQGEPKPADKVEPKFKDGDWITNGEYTWYVEGSHNGFYDIVSSEGCKTDDTISHVDEHFHIWTIQDAKAGDVLEFGDHGRLVVGIVSYVNKTTGKVDVNCLLENNNFKVGNYYNLDTIKPHPATKEQRDLLFQEMKEKGYEWDAEKKELKKIEQKSAECLKPEKDCWYVCIKDFYGGGKRQCSVGDLVQAKGGMYMMGREDISEWFRRAYYEEVRDAFSPNTDTNIPEEEYVKRFKSLCNAYEIKLPNREYDIYHLCHDLSKLSIDSGNQKPTEWSEDIIRKAIREVGLTQHQIDWFKTNVFPPKQEWSEEGSEKELDEFTENIRRLITEKLTYHATDGSGISSTVFIDDVTAKDIANGVLFYAAKEVWKNPDREISGWDEEDEEMFSSIQQWLDENEPQYVKKEKTWLKSLRNRLKTN